MGMIILEIIGIPLVMYLYYISVINSTDLGFLIFCNEDAQKKAVSMGLIKEKKIEKQNKKLYTFLSALLFLDCPILVYILNKPDNFLIAFFELSLLYIVSALFDIVFTYFLLKKIITNQPKKVKKKLDLPAFGISSLIADKPEAVESLQYIFFSFLFSGVMIFLIESSKLIIGAFFS